ncbi:Ni/Fe hydrogenase subunit alpha [Rubripirellula reticaptiva]|uniref:NAD-reducing hydrogenase HoxS subunit beta n=1 Tax=Rubripirellula reticaptiva TaxID=2528013 RepID=A0A5C6EDI4_9BACT|nr:nickel-dependent hydrogenase large subunit [Rubripirellula reticaptiva]TWU46700.1 NAD-reducing hydrogenase HoxS subunit beta [Rubripirellula reticaptiva]
MTKTLTITVNALTRVEGEGALHVQVNGDTIESVRLAIYEPPRFFEAFLRGRKIEEVPDITARICGICPVAYQMTSVHAIENALGIRISLGVRQLRRLLYCAEWIESHVLHIFMLNAPDFFDCHSGIELAEHFPDQVNMGLRMKKIGNGLLELLGGRAIHPVNVRIGGFYRLPTRDELARQLPDLRWALDAAVKSAHWIAGFDFPEFNIECELVAMKHASEYPMNEGEIASTRFPSIPVDRYEEYFGELQVQHSTALQSVRRDSQTPYFLGPLARLELNHGNLTPQAKKLFQDICPPLPLRNRFHSIIARIIEVVHAFEEAIAIIESYSPPSEPFTEYKSHASRGCAATEAPRGMIYHHYEIDDRGSVVSSKIVPPTSQNQLQIEADLREYLPRFLQESDETIASECEKLIRNYDPCISCSTHFLTLRLERT